MAPKKKSNKKQENLEELGESGESVVEPVSNVEPVVLETAPVTLEELVVDPIPNVEPVVDPIPNIEPIIEPIPTVEHVKESIDLEINEIFNPLLSNDLENLLLQNVERPKSPPPRRINKRGATMGMKLGF